jgi:hypothetical protein
MGASITSAPGAGLVFAIALICVASEYLQYDGAAVRVKDNVREETPRMSNGYSQWRSGAPR